MTLDSGETDRRSVRLRWAAVTDRGKVRDHNEDSYVAAPGLFAVADGMGGHTSGDVASRIVVDTCASFAMRVPFEPEGLVQMVAEANRRVLAHAHEVDRVGMGTTLVAVALVDDGGDESLMVLNVGDSRCYACNDGKLVQVTRDHSVVQELIDGGEIDELEARTHRERNVVTRAIGIEPRVVADFFVLPSVGRSRLLLCSDGVSSQVAFESIEHLLVGAPTPEAGAAALLGAVLEGPAPDNATALVVDVEWQAAASSRVPGDEAEITGPRPSPQPLEMIDTVPVSEAAELPAAGAVEIHEAPV